MLWCWIYKYVVYLAILHFCLVVAFEMIIVTALHSCNKFIAFPSPAAAIAAVGCVAAASHLDFPWIILQQQPLLHKKRTHGCHRAAAAPSKAAQNKQLHYDFDDCDLWSLLCMLTFDLHWHLMKRKAHENGQQQQRRRRQQPQNIHKYNAIIMYEVWAIKWRGGMIREMSVFEHDLDDYKVRKGCVSLVLTR